MDCYNSNLINIQNAGKSIISNALDLLDNNTNSQQSYLQVRNTERFNPYGCCSFLKNSRGNYRVIIPNENLKVSLEVRDRWLEELRYLYGMDIVEEDEKGIKKLIEDFKLPKPYISKTPEDLSVLIVPLYSLYHKILNEFFEEYKQLIIKYFDKFYKQFIFRIYKIDNYNNSILTSSTYEDCLNIIKTMRLSLSEEKVKYHISERYGVSDIVTVFQTIAKIISKETINVNNILGAFNSIGMPQLFSPYGLLIDSSKDAWITCDSHADGTRQILAPEPKYCGIHVIHNYLSRGMGRWFHAGAVTIPEAVELENKIKEFILNSEETQKIKELLSEKRELTIYKVKMVNKCKLIPHTMIRALWTNKNTDTHFIEAYFHYKDKYPHLDPYFLMNICSNGFYQSSYGTPSQHGCTLRVVPNINIDTLVTKVKQACRSKITTEVRGFYTTINKLKEEVDMTHAENKVITKYGAIYVESLISEALKLYDK